MCGRYASSRNPDDLVEMFDVVEVDLPDVPPAPDYNVAPTVAAPVVLERARRPAAEEPVDDAPPEVVRSLRYLRWGLVPSWAKDRSSAARMINARAEGLLEKPAFRKAALARRCLVPADGWYEWQVPAPVAGPAGGKPRKQPYFIRPADGGGVAFAGVYEFWRDPAVSAADDPAAWLVSFSIVTTAAEPGLAPVHDRMPLVLPPAAWPEWLDPAQQRPEAVVALLQPPPEGRFVAVPVTTRVNSVRNNGPELLEPDTSGGLF